MPILVVERPKLYPWAIAPYVFQIVLYTRAVFDAPGHTFSIISLL